MKNHKFAIGETGHFNLNKHDPSFVCSILVSQPEHCLKQKQQKAYTEFGLEGPPNNVKTLLENKSFHFSTIDTICKNLLSPLSDKIYISKGKRALFANNQNWWVVALTVLIQEFFKQQEKIQYFGLVNNQNKFHTVYNTMTHAKKRSSSKFKDYADVKENRLNKIKTRQLFGSELLFCHLFMPNLTQSWKS